MTDIATGPVAVFLQEVQQLVARVPGQWRSQRKHHTLRPSLSVRLGQGEFPSSFILHFGYEYWGRAELWKENHVFWKCLDADGSLQN